MMDPTYFETHFKTPAEIDEWPEQFAIVTAHATTGETWTDAENDAANHRLENELAAVQWVRPVAGYSPHTAHAEAGWAVEMTFDAACDLGQRFHQDAIYYIEGDVLFVSHCDARRDPVRVGRFRERLTSAEIDPNCAGGE